MILNGKAKIDFETWLRNSEYGHTNYGSGICFINGSAREFFNLQKNLQNAIIIEWLISVNHWENVFYYEYRRTGFKDYKLATENAIKVGIDSYNEKQSFAFC